MVKYAQLLDTRLFQGSLVVTAAVNVGMG